jgi:hypothetical protein
MGGQTMSLSGGQTEAIYEIQVRGELDKSWENWFNGLDVTLAYRLGQPPTTILTAPMADQAALRGMLCKLWDMNLTLISVRCIQMGSRKEDEND